MFESRGLPTEPDPDSSEVWCRRGECENYAVLFGCDLPSNWWFVDSTRVPTRIENRLRRLVAEANWPLLRSYCSRPSMRKHAYKSFIIVLHALATYHIDGTQAAYLILDEAAALVDTAADVHTRLQVEKFPELRSIWRKILKDSGLSKIVRDDDRRRRRIVMLLANIQ
jgi:hypothetical protein